MRAPFNKSEQMYRCIPEPRGRNGESLRKDWLQGLEGRVCASWALPVPVSFLLQPDACCVCPLLHGSHGDLLHPDVSNSSADSSPDTPRGVFPRRESGTLPSVWGMPFTLDWSTVFQDHRAELRLVSMIFIVESEIGLGGSPSFRAKLPILEEPMAPWSQG